MLKTHVYDENRPKTRDNRRKKSESEVYLRYIAGEYFIYSFSTHIFGPIGIIYEKKVVFHGYMYTPSRDNLRNNVRLRLWISISVRFSSNKRQRIKKPKKKTNYSI